MNQNMEADIFTVSGYKIVCRGDQALYPGFRATSAGPGKDQARPIQSYGDHSALSRPYYRFANQHAALAWCG